ncbi:hypothetical protein BGW80DRAFT_1445663 [Lactifluus volemus]|nr:hypothetical protein BGW80DRAFT_1445663 [Lactifluus volemus]
MSKTFNSIGQDPCTVIGYLLSPCYGGFSPYAALPEADISYIGPAPYEGNACKCSTVAYSLLSACAACQYALWISWSEYTRNCQGIDLSRPETEKLAPSYLFAIPNGTSVPYWALIDVTVEGIWNLNESRAVGNIPEAGPGAVINTPASSAILSSSFQATHSPTATSSKSRGSSSNVGAIAGGVVGGIVVLAATAFIFFFLGRRMHRQGSPTAPVFDPTPQPLMDEVRPQSSDGGAFVPPPLPDTRAPPIRPYDPDDPTTFPWNQGANPVPKPHAQVPAASDTGHTPANMPISPPPIYHSLPVV